MFVANQVCRRVCGQTSTTTSKAVIMFTNRSFTTTTTIIHPTLPKRNGVVMCDAGLTPVQVTKQITTEMPQPTWDDVMKFAKSPAMKKQFEEARNNPSFKMDALQEKPSMNYAVPKGFGDIEWGLLSEVVSSEEGKKQLAECKAVINEIQEWIKENNQPPPTIDWKYYHNALDEYLPGAVDQFKLLAEEAINSIQDIDLTPQIEEFKRRCGQMNQSVEKYCAGMEQLKQEFATDLEAMKTEKPIVDMSTEEVLTLYPAIAAEIEKEIAEGDWSI